MTDYSNPTPKEGINTSSEHPLKEFAQLLLGVGAVVVLLILVINAFADVITRNIPFEYEQRMATNIDFVDLLDATEEDDTENTETQNPKDSAQSKAQEQRVKELAALLTPLMGLPEGMTISVHYSNSDVVNAFATLGGNVIFFKGLVDQLESDQALAAVIAHEIAHIKYRHPISALGKGVMLGTLAAFVGGASGSSAGEWLIGHSSNLTLMKFSRDQERQADQAAAQALQDLYGHIGGAEELFRQFSALESDATLGDRQYKAVEMFRSHPYSQDRWVELQSLARERGWSTSGEMTPLHE